MNKDKLSKEENTAFDQASQSSSETLSETLITEEHNASIDPIVIENSKKISRKAYVFSYLTNINRIELVFTSEILKVKYKWIETCLVFPTQYTSDDSAKQKVALRLEAKIEEAFSLTTLNQQKLKKEMGNQKRWRILAVVLLIIGIGGLSANTIYGNYVARKVEKNTQMAIKKIKKEQANKGRSRKKEQSIFQNQPYQPIETYLDDSDIETYLGSIAIPDVNLNLPIVKGVGEKNLYRGAATNKIGQQMGKGNYPMAAHKVPGDDTSLFGPLFQVTPGMKIYLSDNQNIYIYSARESYVVDPERVDILDDVSGQTLLTLYTCSTDAGVERLVVQADFEKQLKMTDASPEEQAVFARE